jgi:hypothetical protein
MELRSFSYDSAFSKVFVQIRNQLNRHAMVENVLKFLQPNVWFPQNGVLIGPYFGAVP